MERRENAKLLEEGLVEIGPDDPRSSEAVADRIREIGSPAMPAEVRTQYSMHTSSELTAEDVKGILQRGGQIVGWGMVEPLN